jgi:transketolase
MGFVGMNGYAESGTWKELLEKYGLTADAIAREVRAVLDRKRRAGADGHGG